MPTLRPEYGPTLPALLAKPLRTDQRRIRLGLLLIALVVVVLAVVVSALRSGQALRDVLVRQPVAFTLAHTDALQRVVPQSGEVLRLASPAGADPAMTYAARPIDLGAYRGDPTASLGLRASRDATALARALPSYASRGEGKTRVNASPGYQLSYQYRSDRTAIYAKRLYLVPPVEPGDPAPREGIELTLTGSRGAVFPNVASIGANGALKQPLRSFRFGTERP